MRTKTALLASVAGTMIWLPSVAFAQTQEQPLQIDRAADVADDQEIVVTARGRVETLLETPAVVSVLDNQALQRYDTSSLAGIGQLVPNVQVINYPTGGTGGGFSIRGINTNPAQQGFETPVSVSLDGVQTSYGRIVTFGYFDLDRVEVVSGPQALFAGKNALAGVIAITSALPSSTPEFSLTSSYEFVADELTVDAVGSLPISSNLSGRIAVRYRNMRGWLRNTAQPLANPFFNPATGAPAGAAQLPGASSRRVGDEQWAGRLTLEWRPTSDISAVLRIFGVQHRDEGPGVGAQNIGPCTGPNPRVSGVADPFGDCVADNRTTVGDTPAAIAATYQLGNQDGRGRGSVDAIITSLNTTFDLGRATLSSITGYNWVDFESFGGQDHTTYSAIASASEITNWQFSQELRLNTQFDSPINFMLGLYYQKTFEEGRQDVKLSDLQYNPVSGRFVLLDQAASQRGITYSAFGQARWNITPDLELALGLRWTREEKDIRKFNLYGLGAFDTLTTIYPGSNEPGVLIGDYSEDNLSPEATFNWRVTPDISIFGGYRTGFQSGGFTFTSLLSIASRISDFDFESVSARGFELGTHMQFMGRRLRINAAVFGYNYTNLQVTTFDPVAVAFLINNAGRLQQRGAEFDITYRATHQLTLRGAIAYVDNTLSDFVGQCYSYTFPTGATRATATPPPNCRFVNATALTLEQDYEGRAPARSPSLTGNAGFTYAIPVGSHSLTLNGDVYYSSSYYAAETLIEASRQDAFWRVNAGIGIASADDRYELNLIGRNLTNQYYLLYAADRTGGAGLPGNAGEQRAVVARGREVVLQARFRF